MDGARLNGKLMRDEDRANQEQNEFEIFCYSLDDFDINEISIRENSRCVY